MVGNLMSKLIFPVIIEKFSCEKNFTQVYHCEIGRFAVIASQFRCTSKSVLKLFHFYFKYRGQITKTETIRV